MPVHAPRRLLGAVAAALLLGLLTSATVRSPLAGAAEDPRATTAATWLARELERGGGSLPDPLGEAPDLGLTADAIVALSLAGDAAAARPATDVFFERLGSYTSWDDLGSELAGVRLAGPYAKALLVAVVQGLEASAAGTAAEQAVRSLMQASGAQAGRFSDDNPHSEDASNGFGQATAVLALARTADGIPPAALGFLLAQQCPGGGFRLFYDAAPSCGDAGQSDTDTTSLTVQALLAAPSSPAVEAAISGAAAWLQARQDLATGAFGGTGPTDAPNANSTGLAAQALRAAGQLGPADRAAAWVDGLQLREGAAGAASDDVGAIAYDEAGRDTAQASGIGDLERDQWRRATSQAVLAFGLPPLVPVAAQPPGTSTTTTTTTTSSPTTSSPTTSTTTTASTSTTTSPTVLGQEVVPPGSAGEEDLSTEGRRDHPTGLARTGSDVLVLAGAGTASAAAGAAMVVAARKRRS